MTVLIATLSLETAKRVHAVIPGDRSFVFSVDQLVQHTRVLQPRVILLNARFGQQRERVVERIPQLMRLAPGAQVIVVTYSPSETEVADLADLGAYAYIDGDRPGALMRLGDIIVSARKKAKADRCAFRLRGAALLALH